MHLDYDLNFYMIKISLLFLKVCRPINISLENKTKNDNFNRFDAIIPFTGAFFIV